MPESTLTFMGAAATWLLAGAGVLCALGLALGVGIAPADLGHTEAFRIIYIHVPATWAALLLYALLVTCSALYLMTGGRKASMVAEAIAPTGALFALLALWTGSLWSIAVAGVWWDWDARRLADVTLLTFFVASALLREAFDDRARCDVPIAVLVLAGAAIAIFVLHAVDLVPQTHSHPDATARSIGARLVASLAVMTAGFMAYGAGVVLKRLRCVILECSRGCESPQHGYTWR